MDIYSQIIIAAVNAALKADKQNVYTNPAPVSFMIGIRTPAYDGVFWRFEPIPGKYQTQVTLKPYGERTDTGLVICDGASKAPDRPEGVIPGTKAHDPGYLEKNAIAEAWKFEEFDSGPNLRRNGWMPRSSTWTPADVRLLFDAIFGDIMRKAGASNALIRTYYSTVRYLGGIFSRISGETIVLILSAGLLAVSGCLDPPHIIEPNDEFMDWATNKAYLTTCQILPEITTPKNK